MRFYENKSTARGNSALLAASTTYLLHIIAVTSPVTCGVPLPKVTLKSARADKRIRREIIENAQTDKTELRGDKQDPEVKTQAGQTRLNMMELNTPLPVVNSLSPRKKLPARYRWS